MHTEKEHFCFYINSTNQTFTFIRSKVVYFKKNLASIAFLGNKAFTAVKCSVSQPDNYTCSRSNGEATPNLIKRYLEKWAKARPHTIYCK